MLIIESLIIITIILLYYVTLITIVKYRSWIPSAMQEKRKTIFALMIAHTELT